MKFLLLTILLFFMELSSSFSQTSPLCVDKRLSNLNKYRTLSGNTDEKISCGFLENEYAYRKIEILMKLAGLPMNFTVCKAEKIENAYATVDSNGTRYIVYDDVFLKKLDEDSSRLQSITVLAHEIGHHLSAHTLFINDENFQNSYNKYCKKESPNYSEKICKEEYLKYLKLGRDQELEADRFAGFIMYKYGATLDQVVTMYNKIANNNNDIESTHPNLNKRSDAVKAGYNLAVTKAKLNTDKIDLQEIKGGIIDFEVKNLSRIVRNRFISKIRNAATYEAMGYVAERSKYKFDNFEYFGYPRYKDQLVKYHGHVDNYHLIDKNDEYFELWTHIMRMADDKRIQYEPAAAIHLKGNILKLLIFNTPESPKVVYSAPFTEDQISFEEIKTIFIEIFKNGIQKEIDKYY
jgi:hypothetical protein